MNGEAVSFILWQENETARRRQPANMENRTLLWKTRGKGRSEERGKYVYL